MNGVHSRATLEEYAEGHWHAPRTATDVAAYEVAEDILFVTAFGNGIVFRTGDGLVLLDGGAPPWAGLVHEAVRGWSPLPVHTVIYTHGHIDHVSGVAPFDAEADAAGRPRARIVAHEAVARRFDTYARTPEYRRIVNGRQFRAPATSRPEALRPPDLTYSNRLDLDVSGLRLELHHASGETDDHTWIWLPDRRLLCCGDLFIWAAPNAGNPQKALRNPATWAAALREMASLGAEAMLPGHGFPVFGAERVAQALGDTAEYLESLVDQVLVIMNRGGRLDEVLRTVRPPAHLAERPYLRPSYDDPEFILHNAWRVFGGWWDGNPATLKPAGEVEVARELAELAGGAIRLAERARALAREGRLRPAAHLAELAALAGDGDPAIHEIRAEVFGERAEQESSLMARNLFRDVAEASRQRTRER